MKRLTRQVRSAAPRCPRALSNGAGHAARAPFHAVRQGQNKMTPSATEGASLADQAHRSTARVCSCLGLLGVRGDRGRPGSQFSRAASLARCGATKMPAPAFPFEGRVRRTFDPKPENIARVGRNDARTDPTLNFSATPARRAAGVALHAGAVAHKRVVTAVATGLALVALHLGLRARVHCHHARR